MLEWNRAMIKTWPDSLRNCPANHCCLHPGLTGTVNSFTPPGATAFWGAAGMDLQLGLVHVTWQRAFSMACGLAVCREQPILWNNAVTHKATETATF